MGTNFYARGSRCHDHMDPDWHIGKRSASGLYCWDCKRTLCINGEGGIHCAISAWSKVCLSCGKSYEDEGWEGAAGRELGFAKEIPKAKVGVRSCSSFTWAMPEPRWQEVTTTKPTDCPGCKRAYDDPEKIIEDEYGKTYTLKEFQEVLEECPVVYQDRGKYFL